LIADKAYDSDKFREELDKRDIAVCIPSRARRREPLPYDKELYKQRNRIERMFGRLKDWRRITVAPTASSPPSAWRPR
jgi:transposase